MKKTIIGIITVMAITIGQALAEPAWYITYDSDTYKATAHLNGNMKVKNSTQSASTSFEITEGSITKVGTISGWNLTDQYYSIAQSTSQQAQTIAEIRQGTATLQQQYESLPQSATAYYAISAGTATFAYSVVGIDTTTLNNKFTQIGQSTASLQNQVNAVIVSTGELKADINYTNQVTVYLEQQLGITSSTLQGRLDTLQTWATSYYTLNIDSPAIKNYSIQTIHLATNSVTENYYKIGSTDTTTSSIYPAYVQMEHMESTVTASVPSNVAIDFTAPFTNTNNAKLLYVRIRHNPGTGYKTLCFQVAQVSNALPQNLYMATAVNIQPGTHFFNVEWCINANTGQQLPTLYGERVFRICRFKK